MGHTLHKNIALVRPLSRNVFTLHWQLRWLRRARRKVAWRCDRRSRNVMLDGARNGLRHLNSVRTHSSFRRAEAGLSVSAVRIQETPAATGPWPSAPARCCAARAVHVAAVSEAHDRHRRRRIWPVGVCAAVRRHRRRDQADVAGARVLQAEALRLPQPPFLDLQIPHDVHPSRRQPRHDADHGERSACYAARTHPAQVDPTSCRS